MRATYLSINTAIFGIASFFGNLLGGYITDNFLLAAGTFNGINTGLLISAVLRLSTGLLYFSIYETYKPTQRISE
jgi:hypothetical protein